MLEDRPSDAELVQIELRRGGYELEFTRVDDEQLFREAINSGSWDLVLADYNLPNYDAISALREMRRQELDFPFIIISGAIGEDVAVAAVREGAADYLFKDLWGFLTAIG